MVSAAGKAARSKAFIQAAFYGVGQALGAAQADASSVDDFEVASNGNLTSNTASTSVGSSLWWAKVAAHSAVGCLAARANDGNCAKGAASSGVTAGATDSVTQSLPGDYVAQGTALAVLGGVTSVISGDKFANGATMALYGYIYNYLMSLEIYSPTGGGGGVSLAVNPLTGDFELKVRAGIGMGVSYTYDKDGLPSTSNKYHLDGNA